MESLITANPVRTFEKWLRGSWRRLYFSIRKSLLFEERVDHSLSSHLTTLLILGTILTLPFILSFNPSPHPNAGQLRILNIAIPELCLSHRLFHVECPGCGLTRSFVALAHGDWLRAYEFHRLGAVLYAYIVFLVVFHITGIAVGKRPMSVQLVRLHRKLGVLMILLLIANWAFPLLV